MYETGPKSIVPDPASRLGTMSLSFDLGVDTLPAANTIARSRSLIRSTQKAAFWRTPILLDISVSSHVIKSS